jgi:hypothetical protein
VHDLDLPTKEDLILQNIHLIEGEKEYSCTFEVNMLHAKVGSLLTDRLMQIINGEIVTPISN